MKKLMLFLTIAIVSLTVVYGTPRKFKIAYFLPGNGSTQYTVVEAPDAGTAQQIFKATFQNCRFSSYTEIR
jgi:hypothetical protein